MRNLFFYLGVCCVFSFLIIACQEEEYTPIPPKVSIENLTGNETMVVEDTIWLKAQVVSPLETALQWLVNGELVSDDSIFAFTTNQLGKYNIVATATNTDGEMSTSTDIEVYGKYKYGTFVLSEGSGSDGGGSLVFISPKGVVTDTVFRKENNGARLGMYSQDMYIHNNKMYIVSQNGGNEGGYLTIVNAETMKYEKSFQEELKGKVSAPTHIVVLSEQEIYLRCNKGISRFNPSTLETTFIKGSNGVRKNTMAVVNGKIFASKGKEVRIIESGKDSISSTISFDANVSGVVRSSDGNLWVSTADGFISKVDVSNCSIIKRNDTGQKSALSASYAASPSITAKGDTLYMSGLTSKIYRHIFSSNTTELMVDVKDYVEDCNIIYNTVAVHPITGEVYLNSIKGYGTDYTKNNISVFNFSVGEAQLKDNYRDHTRFPAGTFFTYNFE